MNHTCLSNISELCLFKFGRYFSCAIHLLELYFKYQTGNGRRALLHLFTNETHGILAAKFTNISFARIVSFVLKEKNIVFRLMSTIKTFPKPDIIDKHEILGENLFVKISSILSNKSTEDISKITGILLENEEDEIFQLLKEENLLQLKINEVLSHMNNW